MSLPARWDVVLTRLEQERAVLLGQVADELTYTIPLLAVPPTAPDFAAYHQRQMLATVERLHDNLQAARLNEQLLVHEFAWAARVLPRWGVTAEHLATVIDTYVQIARTLATWEPEALELLEELRSYLHQVARMAFPVSAESVPA